MTGLPLPSPLRRQFLLRTVISLAAVPLVRLDKLLAQADPLVQQIAILAFELVPDAEVDSDLFSRVAKQFLDSQSLDNINDLLRLLPSDWSNQPADHRQRIIGALSQYPLLRSLRNQTAATIYSQPEVWQRIGYGGSSFEFGGYLGKGFDDIDWLPDVAR